MSQHRLAPRPGDRPAEWVDCWFSHTGDNIRHKLTRSFDEGVGTFCTDLASNLNTQKGGLFVRKLTVFI